MTVEVAPWDFRMFTELQVPDPITFVLSPLWLAQEQLYPRQGTLLKIIFLREDLFTEYDYDVVAEWESNFRSTGNNGIVPDILLRMRYLKAHGYKWFREVLLVMGRRAGKGHVAALAISYVLWNYMSTTDPQKHYGIASNKNLECLIYAGKKEQARKNLWSDVHDAIVNSNCFSKYISRALGESLSVYAPQDIAKKAKRAKGGVKVNADEATFRIEPKEATLMSGRGGASCIVAFDEMAHVVATGANRSAEEVYGAVIPSLDQFKKDAFIIEPSSPWQMTGQFYKNYTEVLQKEKVVNDMGEEVETDQPAYPNKMMIQLASWDIYKDWEVSDTIPVFPEDYQGDLGEYKTYAIPNYPHLKSSPQEYNDEMQKEQKSNPDTFNVERLAHWATTMDAYLDQEKIKAMWDDTLQMRVKGPLNMFYYGHVDPSSSNANFGFAVAHTEPDPNGSGMQHCVFDYIYHWSPQDFPDGHIDYVAVIDQLWNIIASFPIDEFTFDQFSSGPIRSMLQEKALRQNPRLPKQPMIHEVTASAPLNWKKAENFKTALNQGWIRAPYNEQADLELRFLRLTKTATTMRVDKQDTGPCTTKDVADCLFQCVHALLGDQIEAIRSGLGSNPVSAGLQGGITPFGNIDPTVEKMFDSFSGGGAGKYRGAPGFGGSTNPTRGVRRDAGYKRSRSGY